MNQNMESTKNESKAVILAVDDKPEILASIAGMLKDKYTVICVTSAAKALKALGKHMPKLFILDIEMPEMDGFELAQIIRTQARFADTPIIFLTGKNTKDDVNSAIMTRCNDYILKPVNKDLLLKKVGKFV